MMNLLTKKKFEPNKFGVIFVSILTLMASMIAFILTWYGMKEEEDL